MEESSFETKQAWPILNLTFPLIWTWRFLDIREIWFQLGKNVLENETGCSEVLCFFNVSAKLCLCVVLNNVTLAETPSLIFPLLLILLPRQRAILSMEPTRSFCQVVAHLITPPLLLCQILYHRDHSFTSVCQILYHQYLIGLPPRGRAHIVCLQWILAQGSLPVSLVSLPKKHDLV